MDYEEELYKTLVAEEEPPISDIIELLREANSAGNPIDLDSTYYEDDETSYLNKILWRADYKVSDIDVIKEILDQAKKLDAYYYADDDKWYSPLSWIFWTDEKLGIALIPYFKKRGYKIIKDEEKEYNEEFLKEWNALEKKNLKSRFPTQSSKVTVDLTVKKRLKKRTNNTLLKF